MPSKLRGFRALEGWVGGWEGGGGGGKSLTARKRYSKPLDSKPLTYWFLVGDMGI